MSNHTILRCDFIVSFVVRSFDGCEGSQPSFSVDAIVIFATNQTECRYTINDKFMS